MQRFLYLSNRYKAQFVVNKYSGGRFGLFDQVQFMGCS